MSTTQFHVMADRQGWRVERDGELLSEHQTQDGAASVARLRAQADPPAEVRVHGADGEVHSSSVYLAEPFPKRPTDS